MKKEARSKMETGRSETRAFKHTNPLLALVLLRFPSAKPDTKTNKPGWLSCLIETCPLQPCVLLLWLFNNTER